MAKDKRYEDLVWEDSPSQWLNIRWHITLIFALFGTGAAIAQAPAGQTNIYWYMPLFAVVLFWLWQLLVVRCTRFYLLHERIIIERGVLNKTTDQVELHRVRDYRVNEPLLQRMAGIGAVRIWSIDRNEPVFVIPGMKEPRKLHELIRQTKMKYIGKTQQFEIG